MGGDVFFSAAVQKGPGAYPASSANGTGAVSRKVKRQRSDVDHPPPDQVQPYFYSPSVPARYVNGETFTFTQAITLGPVHKICVNVLQTQFRDVIFVYHQHQRKTQRTPQPMTTHFNTHIHNVANSMTHGHQDTR